MTTAQSRPIRVAIIGGGCAGMTTAFELSRPEHRGKYEVTVYQRGWRLGGKGASGRGIDGRIEEHGLHVWMGYYENAFRLMRECYAELGRDPATCPIATFADAFHAADNIALADQREDGTWTVWQAKFPTVPGLPGDPAQDAREASVAEYMRRLLALARRLVQSAVADKEPPPTAAAPTALEATPESLQSAAKRLLQYGVLAGFSAVLESLRLLELAFELSITMPDNLLLRLVDAARRAVQSELERYIAERDDLRRIWAILDIVFAVVRGSIRHRLLGDPRGFDAIDNYDCRAWLLENGATPRSLQSPFVRGLYDLAFAYEGGDVSRPRIAAGAGIRAALRAFLTYRGAFFWKMNAGMGDIVFAPLYELLSRRGVRFEFFHELEQLRVAREANTELSHIERLEFAVQARVRGGREYRPLTLVGDLPCFPAEPDRLQLESNGAPAPAPWQLESHAAAHAVEARVLRVGEDFDLVVLAIGLGAVPLTCDELLRASPRWQAMVARVKTVPTQAFQLWLDASVAELGFTTDDVSLSGFVEPFDTWADMTHVSRFEQWREPPRSIAYFCSVLRDDAHQTRDSARQAVRTAAERFMEEQLVHLWPNARSEQGGFRWELLKQATTESHATTLEGQYWTANIDASDRYVLSLPDSNRHRISPLDRDFDNLTVAGDWTASGLNLGCVEGAVMSGRLAAHAISQSPPLEDIVGFDSP